MNSGGKLILPTRAGTGIGSVISFSDAPDFRPNLTPSDIFKQGAFGGGYFRPIHSRITGKDYADAWKEFPSEWWEGMVGGPKKWLANQSYNVHLNRFQVDCGAKLSKDDTFGLDYWEDKKWIVEQDPYGWVQWYCRFYQGRRSPDDGRQIARWLALAGPSGRFRSNLIGKAMGKGYDNQTVSPVIRQTLHQWGYQLTKSDFEEGVAKRLGAAPAREAKDTKNTKRNGISKKRVMQDDEDASESEAEVTKSAKKTRRTKAK
ncbi:hypothetical protein BC830DRAFT_1163165 [Chytriomyces sp. MP71]|nr:hypothetical protein BC830DRAFT_1163165 [Chytriomyces sp. MP71]